MHKAAIAQWILALVTDQDRAAATVGDLLEASSRHGGIWFWSNILRTASAQVWSTFALNPLGTLGVAVLASLFACLAGALALFVSVFVSALTAGLFEWRPVLAGPLDWLVTAWSFAIAVLPCYLAGRWIARKAHGAEVAPALAATFLYLAGAALLNVIPPYGAFTTVDLASPLAILAGAVVARRRLAQ